MSESTPLTPAGARHLLRRTGFGARAADAAARLRARRRRPIGVDLGDEVVRTRKLNGLVATVLQSPVSQLH